MDGIELIQAERKRQIQLGWDAEHDIQHRMGELLGAALCYATPTAHRGLILRAYWPQDWDYSPSEDRMRELVKAGALIAAELDRILQGGE